MAHSHIERTADSFTLRNPTRYFAAALTSLFSLVGLALLIFGFDWWQRLAGLLGIAFGLYLVRRMLSRSIRCTADGVLGMGESGTHRLTWSQIDRFEQRGLKGIGARLTDGRWVPLMFFATFGDLSEEGATQLLEEQRLRYQQTVPPQGS